MKNITNKDLQRMKALMGNVKPINENVNPSSVELVKNAPNGKVYGIVRETKKYYIKESNNGVNFDFIGGVGNKTKNQFNSYEEAVKRLNIMFEDFNRTYGIEEGIDILSSDLISEKKFVLKTKKKKAAPEPEAEKEATGFDFGGEDTEEGGAEEGGFDFGGEETTDTDTTEEGGDEFDFGGGEDTEGGEETDTEEGGDEFDFGGEDTGTEETTDTGEETTEFDDAGDEDLQMDDEEDSIKSIQKMTGKLGQKLRDVEDLSSGTMKWVAKSILSALNLDDMDVDDKKDIIRTIKKKKETESDEEFDFMSDKIISRPIMTYMSDEDTVNWDDLSDAERLEIIKSKHHHGMSEDNPNIGGDEDMEGELLLDDEDYMDDMYDMPYMSPQEAPVKPTTKPDVKPGTDKPSPSKRPFTPPPHITPGEEPAPKAEYEDDYDYMEDYGSTEAMDYMEDLTSKMSTWEQEQAYNDIVDMAAENGLTVGYCHKDKSNDPEEKTVYLDILKGKKSVATVRINSVGQVEMGHMSGKYFKGEPIDSMVDFDEVLQEKGIEMNSPAPVKPTTKPDVKPGTDRPSPSKRPFTPPPHITPGEEPAPKAGRRKLGTSYDYMSNNRFTKL